MKQNGMNLHGNKRHGHARDIFYNGARLEVHHWVGCRLNQVRSDQSGASLGRLAEERSFISGTRGTLLMKMLEDVVSVVNVLAAEKQEWTHEIFGTRGGNHFHWCRGTA